MRKNDAFDEMLARQMENSLVATRFAVGAEQPALRERSNREALPAILAALARDPGCAVALFMPRGDLLSRENLLALSDPEALSRAGPRSFSTPHPGAHGDRRTALEALLDCPSPTAALRVSRAMPPLTDSQRAYALWGSKDAAALGRRMERAGMLGWLDESTLLALAAREETHGNGSRAEALGALARLEAGRLESGVDASTPSARAPRL